MSTQTHNWIIFKVVSCCQACTNDVIFEQYHMYHHTRGTSIQLFSDILIADIFNILKVPKFKLNLDWRSYSV